MDSIYFVDGAILKITEDKTKTTNKTYYRLEILDVDNQIHKASCFKEDLFDKLEEMAFNNFKFEKNGNYTNLTEIADISPEATAILEKLLTTMDTPKATPTPTSEKHPGAQLYINLNGKTYVTQAGLLAEAHNRGIQSIETEMLEFRDQEIAVVKSRVTMKDGTTFTGYGDATKENVNSMISKHLLRMAETRATNRALRLATNIGMTSIEELGGAE